MSKHKKKTLEMVLRRRKRKPVETLKDVSASPLSKMKLGS